MTSSIIAVSLLLHATPCVYVNVAGDGSQFTKLARFKSYNARVADTNRSAQGNRCTRKKNINIKHLYVQLADKNLGEHVHTRMVVQRDASARGENNKRN